MYPAPTTVPRFGSLVAWAQSTYYPVGWRTAANGNVYVCVTAGLSAAAGTGPAGGGAGIADNAAVWDFVAALSAAWAPLTVYALGDVVTNDGGKLYQAIAAGTSAAATGPTGTAGVITDDTVTWTYTGSAIAQQTAPTSRTQDLGPTPGSPLFAQYLAWFFATTTTWIYFVKSMTEDAWTWANQHIFTKGIVVTNSTGGVAVAATSNGASPAVHGIGGAGGRGAYLQGGAAGGGNGARAEARSGNAAGLEAVGFGTGAGLDATPGAAGHGITSIGGDTGAALRARAGGTTQYPALKVQDTDGNDRQLFDHLGMPFSQISRWHQPWHAYENLVATGASVLFPEFAANIAGSGDIETLDPTAGELGCRAVRIENGGALDGDETWFYTNKLVAPSADRSIVLTFEVAVQSRNVDAQIWCGLTEDAGGDLALITTERALIRLVAGTWEAYAEDSGGNTGFQSLLAATIGGTPYTYERVRIEIHGANTPFGSSVRFYVNNGVATYSSGSVQPTADLRFSVGVVRNGAGGASLGQVLIGPPTIQFNRYLSGDSI